MLATTGILSTIRFITPPPASSALAMNLGTAEFALKVPPELPASMKKLMDFDETKSRLSGNYSTRRSTSI
jgi:hypothetical protein